MRRQYLNLVRCLFRKKKSILAYPAIRPFFLNPVTYFIMRRNSYIGLREVEQNLIMTKACGATNCTMMEVGGAISSMTKVCGATKSTLNCQLSGNLIMSVVLDVRRYIS